jgi:enamine deaminase RidA (YjgF/YER057c/UK114 family)
MTLFSWRLAASSISAEIAQNMPFSRWGKSIRATMTPARRIRGWAYDEIFDTYSLSPEPDAAEFEAIATKFREETASVPLCAVVFGSPGERSRLPDDIPAVYAGDQYPQRDHFTSVEFRGITPGPDVVIENSLPGVVTFDSARVKRLVFAASSPVGDTLAEQATDVFDQLAKALTAAGLKPRHITRTWYFIGDIDRTYADFNIVRNSYFDEWGLRCFPASTGIGATPPGPALINVLVEATDAVTDSGPETYNTSMQCPPVSYGPRFVRANELTYNGLRTVNISGISSIGRDGKSLIAPTDELVDYSMTSFLDLLTATGMSVADLASSFVYCKGDEVRATFDAYMRQHALAFPYQINHVDVCRPDLVFEIEAKAIRPAATPAATTEPGL